MKKLYSLFLTLFALLGAAFTAQAQDVWKLVSSESELAAGDQLIIATTTSKGSFAMANGNSSNFRLSMEASIANEELSYADGMMRTRRHFWQLDTENRKLRKYNARLYR